MYRHSQLYLHVMALLAFFAVSYAASFIHPGIYNNADELKFIKKMVREKKEPWYSGYKKMLSDKTASLSYPHKGWEHVVRGGQGQKNYLVDSRAAHTHALQWIITGNEAHAKKVIAILNDWSYKLKKVTANTKTHSQPSYKLITGWAAGTFMAGAEIVRYTYDGWKEADIKQCEAFGKVMYDHIEEGQPKFNGNWDASIIRSMMAIAVFRNDKAMWDYALRYFHGQVNAGSKGALKNYIYPSGECQETCRDQSHTQMGLGDLVQACEIGWKQGVDMYGELGNRVALGLEYTAKVLSGVPQKSRCGTKSQKNSLLYPMWEVGYNHYHNRGGLEMTYTKKLVDRTRPSGFWWTSQFMWQTMTHANLPVFEKGHIPDGSFVVDAVNIPDVDPPSPGEDPQPTENRIGLSIAAATASAAQEGNGAANAVDGNMDTRWSVAEKGAWLQLDLGSVQEFSKVGLAFWKGEVREEFFDIAVSQDGETFNAVKEGLKSNGSTIKLQTFDIGQQKARYIRIIARGNSSGDWFSVLEVVVGEATATPLVPMTRTAVMGSKTRAQQWYYSVTGALIARQYGSNRTHAGALRMRFQRSRDGAVKRLVR